jgi:hypothetical protein
MASEVPYSLHEDFHDETPGFCTSLGINILTEEKLWAKENCSTRTN